MLEPEGCATAVLYEDGWMPSGEHNSNKTNVRVKWLHLPHSASALERNFSILGVNLVIQTHPREFNPYNYILTFLFEKKKLKINKIVTADPTRQMLLLRCSAQLISLEDWNVHNFTYVKDQVHFLRENESITTHSEASDCCLYHALSFLGKCNKSNNTFQHFQFPVIHAKRGKTKKKLPFCWTRFIYFGILAFS